MGDALRVGVPTAVALGTALSIAAGILGRDAVRALRQDAFSSLGVFGRDLPPRGRAARATAFLNPRDGLVLVALAPSSSRGEAARGLDPVGWLPWFQPVTPDWYIGAYLRPVPAVAPVLLLAWLDLRGARVGRRGYAHVNLACVPEHPSPFDVTT